jgi:hypothetical protein
MNLKAILVMKMVFLIALLSGRPLMASEPAHVHGEGRLNIAFEGQEGQIEVDVPADSVVGFEYEAKTEKDKKKEKDVLDIFESQASELVLLDPKWGCIIHKEKSEILARGAHRDFEAQYKVRCARPVAAGHIEFNIQNKFPNWKKVKVQVLNTGDRLELK